MSNKKRAFPLRTINVFFLLLIGILCLALIISAAHLGFQFKNYASSSDQYTEISISALTLQEASDYLTEECRLFVLSAELSHLENYFTEINETRRREKSLEHIIKYGSNQNSIKCLQDAMHDSIQLENLEFYAMRLVCDAKNYINNSSYELPSQITNIKLSKEDAALSSEYKISKAWLLLFSQEYLSQKHSIGELKAQAINEIFEYSESNQRQSFARLKIVFIEMITCIAAIFFFVLLFFICVITLVIHPLYRFIRSIREEEKVKDTHTEEFNILGATYNSMFDKNEANEILLRHKAEHDELTGLINRGAYNQIKSALSVSKSNIALILIDVDFFKVINDNYGHATGDKVLKFVSSVLTENFRTTDYVCRIGGDEFAVILTQCDKDTEKTKELIASKMAAIKATLNKSLEDLPPISLSCGIVLSAEGFTDFLYEKADSALYKVKRSGRNDFCFYTEDPELSF